MNGAGADPVGPAAGPGDPVAARRGQVARWVAAGKRVGYAAILVAIVAFAVAVPTDFPSWAVTTVVVAFGVSCVTLLPAVIAGYGINAARREDRERGLPG